MSAPVHPPPSATDRAVGRPWRPAAAGAAAAAVGAVVLLVDPNEPGALGTCPFLAATGLDCPGCGTLRAVRALLAGDPWRALDHNVLATALLPLLVVAWWTWWRAERGRRPAALAAPARLGPALAVVVPVFWVARNLPALGWLAATAG